MTAMVCEICGSNDIVKQDGYFVCQHCGTKYTVEEARKMMIEGTVDVSGSTVKVDTKKQLDNLYQVARRAVDDCNNESMQKYYEMILVEDPNSWEAQFFSVYARVAQCKIGEIENACVILSNCFINVVKLLNCSDLSDESKGAMLKLIGNKCSDLAHLMLDGIWSLYEPNGYYNNPDYFAQKVQSIQEMLNQLEKATKNYLDYGVSIDLNKAYGYVIGIAQGFQEAADERYKKEKAKKGCYVATAVYGSYDCPQVWTLRRFRDNTLAETWYGRAFIYTYYAISPTLVKWFGKTQWFKNMWKPTLDKMVERLNEQGVEATPYNDRNW